MSFKEFMKKFCGICLVLAMVFAMAVPVSAADVSFKQVDNDRVTATLLEEEETASSAETVTMYKSTDIVRVAIVLDKNSTIDQGYSTYGIAQNRSAMNYRQSLLTTQYSVTRAIERKIGEDLDVQWNLTLATNAISANVEYGQIKTIEKVDGVKEVIIESQYSPAVLADSDGSYDPQMAISTDMTGMTEVFNSGYTGAGSRVAIIDTGLNLNHKSFDPDAYLYALAENAEKAGKDYDEYVESLDLLDADEVVGKMSQMNVKAYYPSILSSDLYKNEKVAFAFNYIDKSASYVDHSDDSQTDHGSHVAGIAAANRYIETSENTYKDALAETAVVGNAPDAQLIVMKVFGKAGAPYDSDLVAALEDAIILGADSVNMSLGNNMPSFSYSSLYEEVLSVLEDSDTVFSAAAGNEGAWPDYSNTEAIFGTGNGKLYTDDVMMDRVASPASLTQSMTVASVNNDGMVRTTYMKANGEDGASHVASYTDSDNGGQYSNKPLSGLDTSSDGSGTSYPFVFIDSYGEESKGDLEFIDVTGKIVFIKRGNEIAFADKANYAVSQGAIATVIYNNVSGAAGMDLSSYQYDAPCVIITKEDGAAIREISTPQTAVDGKVYLTGELVVYNGSKVDVVKNNSVSYTMSYFSNWGTTGDLELKPDITAPGGNVYSVNGLSTDKYHTYSGTSMAAPQVAGVTATLKEFIRETGLADKYGLSERVLTQSLMMSTATPLKDSNGNYYSLLQQGAGLVNGKGAVSAESFIMMTDDATPSYADGKVKAEVGDDPERTGVYEFSFEIYNTSEQAKTYDMSAAAFVQNASEDISAPGAETMSYYMEKDTKSLGSDAVFHVNGEVSEDRTVKVPAGGKVTVTACLTLDDEAKAWIDTYYPNGTYMQAFVFAEPQADALGAKSATHSIPMLGFYGNWTDPSMYDAGSFHEGKLLTNYSTPTSTDNSRKSYSRDYYRYMETGIDHIDVLGSNHVTLSLDGTSPAYAFGGNPLVEEVYRPERNAMQNGAVVKEWKYLLNRGAVSGNYKIANLTSGEVYMEETFNENKMGAFCYTNTGDWVIIPPGATAMYYVGSYFVPSISVNCAIPDAKDGDVIEISLTHLPEYYSEGNIGENSTPGKGATLSLQTTIDSTSPVLENLTVSEDGTLDVVAYDSNYVSAVVLYTADGKEVISYTGSKDEIEKGASAVYSVETKEHINDYLLQVYDYAMNVSTYYIEVQEDEIEYSGTLLSYDLEENSWVTMSKHYAEMNTVSETARKYTAATSHEDAIYAVAFGSELYKLSAVDPDETAFISDLGVRPVDLAYSTADNKIYGVTDDSQIVRIDPESGKVTVLGNAPIETNTLACDENGVFYSNRYGSGSVYSYTLDALKQSDSDYDFDGDGVVNDADGQALLEYVTGERGNVNNKASADLDGDGDIDTYDVTQFLKKSPGSATLVTNIGFVSKYMQSMEFDPNSGALYWASYSSEMNGDTEIGFSVLYEIDTETGEYIRFEDVEHQVSSLVILDKQVGSIYEPVGDTEDLKGNEDKFYANTEEQAAIAIYMGVDNSMKSAYLASDNEASEEKAFVVDLCSDVKSYNGKYTVTYDAETMTLDAYEGFGELVSFDEKEGVITFGYAGRNALEANEVAATLTFTGVACESVVTVSLDEVNNEHPATTEEMGSGAHEWGDWAVDSAATCSAEGKEIRTCGKCMAVETRSIPVDGNAHEWGEWQTLTAVEGDTPGTQEHTCTLCGEVESAWVLPEGAELTEATPIEMNTISINEDYLYEAQVYDAGISKAWRISTTDGSIRYLVELSSSTVDNATFKTAMSNWKDNTGGIGFDVKREIQTDGVGATNLGSDLNYETTLNDGIGSMRCYSYYNYHEYTEFDMYFYVGDSDSGEGQMTYINTNATHTHEGFNQYLTRVGVWDVDVLKFKWDEPVADEEAMNTYYTAHIWLDPDLPEDAEVWLDFNATAGGSNKGWYNAVYLMNGDTVDNNVNIVRTGAKVQLENGNGMIQVMNEDFYGYNRYYTIYLYNGEVGAPTLIGNNASSASIALGETYNMDLTEIFTDINGDSLTYTVSVNGGEAQPVDAAYSITPETAGTMVLTFVANDGEWDSDAYTLILKVRSDDVAYGDTNGDGERNSKDATILLRYLAGWDNIELDEKAADVNVDGEVNSKDATILLRYLAGWDDVTIG